MQRRTLLFGLATVVLLICCVIAIIGFEVNSYAQQEKAKFSRVEQYLADHQPQLGDAVAKFLANNPSGGRVDVQSLPVALQAPDVRYAIVGEKHLTLFVNWTPDTDFGFRVWSGLQGSDYDDAKTSIPGVYRFSYCNDLPESSTNRSN